MGFVPPYKVSMQEAANALEAAFTPPWYGIWIDDGFTSERYGTSSYETQEEAQAICEALQTSYERLLYECQFTPRLRAKPVEDPFAFDPRLIDITYR